MPNPHVTLSIIENLPHNGYIIDWDDAESRGKALWSTPEALENLVSSVELSFVMHTKTRLGCHIIMSGVLAQGMSSACEVSAHDLLVYHASR
jgi:hypothetical protein